MDELPKTATGKFNAFACEPHDENCVNAQVGGTTLEYQCWPGKGIPSCCCTKDWDRSQCGETSRGARGKIRHR